MKLVSRHDMVLPASTPGSVNLTREATMIKSAALAGLFFLGVFFFFKCLSSFIAVLLNHQTEHRDSAATVHNI